MFNVSRNGTIAYRSGGSSLPQHLTLRNGPKKLGDLGDPDRYVSASTSPDRTRAAIVIADAQGNQRIFVQDVRGGTRKQVTFGTSDSSPVWRDNETIIFAARNGDYLDLYQKNVDRNIPAVEILKSSQSKTPTSVSSDERRLFFTSLDPVTGPDIWVLPLSSPSAPMGEPCALLRTKATESQAQISPNLQWIAYLRRHQGVHVY